MKKIFVLILGLSLMSLACLQSAVLVQPIAAISKTESSVSEPTANSVKGFATSAATQPAAPACAKVIAIEALNVRNAPNETAVVLAWLKSGEVVQVIDNTHADWWRVKSIAKVGYVRSSYLKESECEP